jgi:hypothetical protein
LSFSIVPTRCVDRGILHENEQRLDETEEGLKRRCRTGTSSSASKNGVVMGMLRASYDR